MVRRPAGRAGATAKQTRLVMSRSLADPLLIQQAGAVIELTLIRPVQSASPLTVVIITIGLLIGLNGLARRIWGNEPRTLESPFSTDPVRIGGVAF